jgi:prolyl 4-hydroxylase
MTKEGEDVQLSSVVADRSVYVIDKDDKRGFLEEYRSKTGLDWINVIPREKTQNFIWPAPYIGFKHTASIYPPHWSKNEPMKVAERRNSFFPNEFQTTELEVVSASPKIFFIKDFLSFDECDHLIDMINPELKRSTVSNKALLDENRTSRTMWINHGRDAVVQNIVQRGFNLLRVPYDPQNSSITAEAIQGLRYDLKQWYREHYDYFTPSDYAEDSGVQTGNNRMATLFLYLTDVEEGGETYFPRFDGNYVHDGCKNPSCFKTKPQRGAAVLFYSMLEDGNLDFNSLHGGCPVIKGTKYAANFWFWDPAFRR